MFILQFFVKRMQKNALNDAIDFKFFNKKNMFPFMQLHVHYVNLMKKKIT